MRALSGFSRGQGLGEGTKSLWSTPEYISIAWCQLSCHGYWGHCRAESPLKKLWTLTFFSSVFYHEGDPFYFVGLKSYSRWKTTVKKCFWKSFYNLGQIITHGAFQETLEKTEYTCTLSEKASGTRSGHTYRFSEWLSQCQTPQITGDVASVPENKSMHEGWCFVLFVIETET